MAIGVLLVVIILLFQVDPATQEANYLNYCCLLPDYIFHLQKNTLYIFIRYSSYTYPLCTDLFYGILNICLRLRAALLDEIWPFNIMHIF